MKMKVLGSETICPFSSQWLSKAFKFVQKLGRELTFRGALENTSARHAARPNLSSRAKANILSPLIDRSRAPSSLSSRTLA